ncbi:MAG: protein ImuA [Halieaceae bacterium]|jgi:protein ImuA
MNALITKILQRTDTWQGRDLGLRREGLTTGYPELDVQLVDGGWPLGATIELLGNSGGLNAMGLFLPAMKTLNEQQRWQAFIAPPCIPYSPLLLAWGIDTGQILLVHPKSSRDLLWSTEQALRSTTCSAVFSWLPDRVRYRDLRRLQVAAAECDVLAVLFRSRQAGSQHAPASLRLDKRENDSVHILKQRGGRQHFDISLPSINNQPGQLQLWELPAYPAIADTQAGQFGA